MNVAVKIEMVATVQMNYRIATRAKHMLMGEIDVGQYRFRHTDTMLPRRHQMYMSALLQLFGRGIIVIDVFAGGQRSAIGFLAPISSRWVPGDDYIVQTATVVNGQMQCEVVTRADMSGQDSWLLGENRTHRLDEFPLRHIARMTSLAETTEAFEHIWNTMMFVFIWERDPIDDLGGLIDWVGQL